MNRGGHPRSPEEPSRAATARTENNAMKNEETMQSHHHHHHHQQQNMLAEAIASLPLVPQNVAAITLFHQLPILYQQHFQHMWQSRILPNLQEFQRLQNTFNFVDKPQLPAVSILHIRAKCSRTDNFVFDNLRTLSGIELPLYTNTRRLKPIYSVRYSRRPPNLANFSIRIPSKTSP